MGVEQILGSAPATTLAGAINNAVTTFSITSGTGWPTGTPGPFVATIDRGLATEEKILVASRSGTTLSSVTRGYDGSTAQSHANLAVIEHTLSAAMLAEANRIVNEQMGTSTYAASNTNAQTSKVTAEGNPRWTRDASGKMTWGPGSGAVDIQLARLAADQLELQDEFRVTRGVSTNLAHSLRVTADTQDRMDIDATGKIQWGSGSGAVDLNLYRASSAKLKTDQALEVGAAFTALSTAAVTGILTASNFKRGTGTPEGSVTGVVGDIYQRTDGAAGTTIYRKESGAGNTGWKPVGGGMLASSTTAVVFNTTVAETDLVNFTIPASALAVGDYLRVCAFGDMLHNSGAGNIAMQLRFKFGSTTAFDTTTGASLGNGANRKGWYIEVLVGVVGASSEILAGDIRFPNVSNVALDDWNIATDATSPQRERHGVATAAEAIGSTITVKITGQMGNSNAADEMKCFGYTAEKLTT